MNDKITKIIKKTIDEWDSVYLYEMECPPNEYDIEIEQLSNSFTNDVSIDELADIIYNIFLTTFENTDTKANEKTECIMIATKIINEINKS